VLRSLLLLYWILFSSLVSLSLVPSAPSSSRFPFFLPRHVTNPYFKGPISSAPATVTCIKNLGTVLWLQIDSMCKINLTIALLEIDAWEDSLPHLRKKGFLQTSAHHYPRNKFNKLDRNRSLEMLNSTISS
jgi:hypothetical protein